MPHIKELVIKGFKSFARETRIPFKNTMNVIVGPNGSGKSNVTDAICFVLGRLGSKSMRAKKLSNLIFAGTSKYKPASEASVEMIFDNTDKGFSLDVKEVSIKRTLRRGGQGIYRINGDVRTRQEVLELLSQAGIDPNGFNIVLQGEIDAFVKMPAESRREIIEEVAGISIYEIRKQRSIKEMDKTEQKLKEIGATLRERTAYLRNLEQERKQALRFTKLQQDVKSYKASIHHRTATEKQNKIDEINIQIKKHQKKIQEINDLMQRNTQQISVLNEKINLLNASIQKSSGIEQEKLNNEITDLRADLAGLEIRNQTFSTQVEETQKRKAEVLETIKTLESEIQDMTKAKSQGKSSTVKGDLESKKQQLEEIDEQRRRLYVLKSNLSSLNPRIDDKKRQIQKNKNESDFLLERIEEIESKIKIKEPLAQHQEIIAKIKPSFDKFKADIEEAQKISSNKEKLIAALERQIQELGKIQDKVSSLDVCPLCKTKMTKDHVGKVVGEAKEASDKYNKEIQEAANIIKESNEKHTSLTRRLEQAEQELRIRAQDTLNLELINEKKVSLRSLSEEKNIIEKEFQDLETKKQALEKQLLNFKTSEENYDSLRLDIQELERRQEKSVGMDITMKQREVERLKNSIRQANREMEEAQDELKEVIEELEQKQEALEEKNGQDQALKQKYKKTLAEKSSFQEKIRFFESDSLHKQNDKSQIENTVNELKINIAQYAAQKEAAEQEGLEFKGAAIMRLPIQELKIRLSKTQNIIDTIGTVNLRSLEVYDDVKREYDKVQEKADILVREKDEILKIIEDIDKKKKKVFVETLTEINKLFCRNFSQLSTKGEATLEPINKKDIFESGIEMLIRVGKGKYFDTQSLSGGEKSLVSLALIFAIQEYKPYCFYIFDEIDAALDRRNSERLANLLKRYMKNGQYIIITHNDSLIGEAPTIYGVSMQDKISNVLSLEV